MKAATTPRHLQALQPQREARAALRSGQFQLHYQPVVDLDNFTIRAVEALLRWNHPVGGLLPPDDFLPGLAQTPVMREITRHVLSEAGRAARHWPDWRIAVNVAATDVVHPRFADVVLAAIDETQMPPSQLVLELTEQSVLHDVGRATANLTKLRDLGVRIALDDFGTGYSSLLYLRDLPISSVKVDRTFVSSIETYDENAAIVESVVRLAKSIGLRVVAEGVETPTQVRFLRSIECDAAQGFLFGRPVPACELAADARPCWTPEKTEGRPRPLTSRRRRPLARQSAGWTPTSDPEIIAEVRQMLGVGASLHTIAAALNRAGSTTEHGARWSSQTVARLVNSLPSSG